MATVNPYLTFNGNCEEAFNYYKSIFGGEFQYKGRFSDMPQDDDKPLSAEAANLIMHISLPLDEGTSLMGSDSSEEFGQATIAGNNVTLSVGTDSKEEADRIFNALADGGKITMPIGETFWGSYFGMATDKFGMHWMVSAGGQE